MLISNFTHLSCLLFLSCLLILSHPHLLISSSQLYLSLAWFHFRLPLKIIMRMSRDESSIFFFAKCYVIALWNCNCVLCGKCSDYRIICNRYLSYMHRFYGTTQLCMNLKVFKHLGRLTYKCHIVIMPFQVQVSLCKVNSGILFFFSIFFACNLCPWPFSILVSFSSSLLIIGSTWGDNSLCSFRFCMCKNTRSIEYIYLWV